MINFHFSKTHLLARFNHENQATRLIPDQAAVGLSTQQQLDLELNVE